MQVHLQGKNFVISDRIRDYVEKKVGKLDRYLTDIEETRVEISQESTKSAKDRNIVQITIRANRGTILRAEDRSEAIYASIDTAVDKIHRQIARYKGKRIARWHGQQNSKRPEDEVLPALEEEVLEVPGAETEPEGHIVRTKHFFVNPMNEDEAVEQMELLGHDFFVFYNADAGRINIVYRRGDGNYGVLDPEVA